MGSKYSVLRNINKNKNQKKASQEPKAKKSIATSKKAVTSSSKKEVEHAGFFHVEVYSKKASQAPKAKKSSARTIHAVLAEVCREEEYSRHVPKEETLKHPPELVFSNLEDAPVEKGAATFAKELESYIDRRLETGEKTFQKRVRGELKTIKTKIDPTQSALVAGVISLPADNQDKFEQWLNLSVEFLKKEYPEGQLKGVIVHKDEANPHLHFYAVSNRDDLNAKMLHQGHLAQRMARAEKKSGSLAFKAEMKRVQDSFFEMVSKPVGLKRKADEQYKRMDRGEYFKHKRMKAQALEMEKAYNNSLWSENSLTVAAKEQKKRLEEKLKQKGVKAFLGLDGSNERIIRGEVEVECQKVRAEAKAAMVELKKKHQDDLERWEAREKALGSRISERFNREKEELKEKIKKRDAYIDEKHRSHEDELNKKDEEIYELEEKIKKRDEKINELQGFISLKERAIKVGSHFLSVAKYLKSEKLLNLLDIGGSECKEGKLFSWGFNLVREMDTSLTNDRNRLRQEAAEKREREEARKMEREARDVTGPSFSP